MLKNFITKARDKILLSSGYYTTDSLGNIVINPMFTQPVLKPDTRTNWLKNQEELYKKLEPYRKALSWYGLNNALGQMTNVPGNPGGLSELYSKKTLEYANSENPENVVPNVLSGIPKEGGGEYTGDEYFNMIKDNEKLLDLSVIDNLFKSSLDKHTSRAFVVMNNPKFTKETSTAIDHMYAQIPGMPKFTDLYKNLKFDDVEKNKEILKKIHFNPFNIDEFASNPELMKNILNFWYLRNTTGSRSVNYYKGRDTFENVMGARLSYDNGSASGGGGNFVIGSPFGGYTRNYTSYGYWLPKINPETATFDDVFNAFEHERNVFNDEEKVRKAILDAIKDSSLKLSDFLRYNSNFTDDINNAVKNGKITYQEANDIISKVADNLGINGYRGTLYSNLGKYFGAMQKPTKVVYRNIDSPIHNLPLMPFEFGSDRMFSLSFNELDLKPIFNLHKTTHFEMKHKYPNDYIDLSEYNIKEVNLKIKQLNKKINRIEDILHSRIRKASNLYYDYLHAMRRYDDRKRKLIGIGSLISGVGVIGYNIINSILKDEAALRRYNSWYNKNKNKLDSLSNKYFPYDGSLKRDIERYYLLENLYNLHLNNQYNK